jgi:hypothetical protein
LGRSDLTLRDIGDTDTFQGIFSQFVINLFLVFFSCVPGIVVGVLLVLRDEVPDLFVVNLDENDLQSVLAIAVSLNNPEKLLHGLVHDAWLFSVAQHGVCLTGTSRTIRKDSTVEAIAYRAAQAHRSELENLLCCCSLVESVVKSIPFLASTVLSQLVFFVFEVLRVPKNHQLFV